MRHIQYAVDSVKRFDYLQRQIHSVECAGQHDKFRTGNACRADGSERYRYHEHNLLGDGQMDSEYLILIPL